MAHKKDDKIKRHCFWGGAVLPLRGDIPDLTSLIQFKRPE